MENFSQTRSTQVAKEIYKRGSCSAVFALQTLPQIFIGSAQEPTVGVQLQNNLKVPLIFTVRCLIFRFPYIRHVLKVVRWQRFIVEIILEDSLGDVTLNLGRMMIIVQRDCQGLIDVLVEILLQIRNADDCWRSSHDRAIDSQTKLFEGNSRADFIAPSSAVNPVMNGMPMACGSETSRGCSVMNAPGKSGSTTGGNGIIGSLSHP